MGFYLSIVLLSCCTTRRHGTTRFGQILTVTRPFSISLIVATRAPLWPALSSTSQDAAMYQRYQRFGYALCKLYFYDYRRWRWHNIVSCTVNLLSSCLFPLRGSVTVAKQGAYARNRKNIPYSKARHHFVDF